MLKAVGTNEKGHIVFRNTDAKPFASYGYYIGFDGDKSISEAEQAYGEQQKIARELCEAVGVEFVPRKHMIVKFMRKETEHLRAIGIPVEIMNLKPRIEDEPVLSVAWRVDIDPEQEQKLGERFNEYKLFSASEFDKEDN